MTRKRGTTPDHRVIHDMRVTRVDVRGDANELTFLVLGYRETRDERTEYVELRLRACRYSVTHLLTELKNMHARDRERIQRELARIDGESKALLP